MFALIEEKNQIFRLFQPSIVSPLDPYSKQNNLKQISIIYPLHKDCRILQWQFHPIDISVFLVLYENKELVFYNIEINPAASIHKIANVNGLTFGSFYYNQRYLFYIPDLRHPTTSKTVSTKIQLSINVETVISVRNDVFLSGKYQFYHIRNGKLCHMDVNCADLDIVVHEIIYYSSQEEILIVSSMKQEERVIYALDLSFKKKTSVTSLDESYDSCFVFSNSTLILVHQSTLKLYTLRLDFICQLSLDICPDLFIPHPSFGHFLALKYTKSKMFKSYVSLEKEVEFSYWLYDDLFQLTCTNEKTMGSFDSELPIWQVFESEIPFDISSLPLGEQKLFRKILDHKDSSILEILKTITAKQTEFEWYRSSKKFEPAKIFTHLALNGLTWKKFLEMYPHLPYQKLVDIFNELHLFNDHVKDLEPEDDVDLFQWASRVAKISEEDGFEIDDTSTNIDGVIPNILKNKDKQIYSDANTYITKDQEEKIKYKNLKQKMKLHSRITPNSSSFAGRNFKDGTDRSSKNSKIQKNRHLITATKIRTVEPVFFNKRKPFFDIDVTANIFRIPETSRTEQISRTEFTNDTIKDIVGQQWFPLIHKTNAEITANDVMSVLMRRSKPSSAVDQSSDEQDESGYFTVRLTPENYIPEPPVNRPQEIKTAVDLYNALPDELIAWRDDLRTECDINKVPFGSVAQINLQDSGIKTENGSIRDLTSITSEQRLDSGFVPDESANIGPADKTSGNQDLNFKKLSKTGHQKGKKKEINDSLRTNFVKAPKVDARLNPGIRKDIEISSLRTPKPKSDLNAKCVIYEKGTEATSSLRFLFQGGKIFPTREHKK